MNDQHVTEDESELQRLEVDNERLTIELGMRDNLIDELRVELEALKAPKPSDGRMTYAQLFGLVAALLPKQSFCIHVSTWLHRSYDPPEARTKWRIWEAQAEAGHEGETAEAALEELKAAIRARIELVAVAAPGDQTGVGELIHPGECQLCEQEDELALAGVAFTPHQHAGKPPATDGAA